MGEREREEREKESGQQTRIADAPGASHLVPIRILYFVTKKKRRKKKEVRKSETRAILSIKGNRYSTVRTSKAYEF